jgi:hypothetical protein
MKPLLTLMFLFLSISGFSQTDCKFLKDCELTYDDGNVGLIVIKNQKHIEYFEDGKYFIKSDLEWLNECEYNATMTEITLPNFPFRPGKIMNVKFESIDGKNITGTGMVDGNKFPIKFIRQK